MTADYYHTCNHVVHRAHFEQHLLDEAHLGARLQVSNTLSKDGGEHAVDLSLAGDVTVPQQLHHAADAFFILDDEVCLQIKLAAHQLQNKMGQICVKRLDFYAFPLWFKLYCVDVMLQHGAPWIKLNFHTADPAFNPALNQVFSLRGN